MKTRSQQFATLAQNNFVINTRFIIREKKEHIIDHTLIITGWVDHTWAIGITSNACLAFWLGDGTSWAFVEALAISTGLKTNINYSLTFERNGPELTIKLDENKVLSLTLPKDFHILGSHIGYGGFKNTSKQWDIECFPENISINKSNNLEKNNFGNTVDLLSMFYGKAYAHSLTEIMFPSLLLSGNIPALKGRKIVHRIYCTAQELPLLADHLRNLDQLGIEHIVDTECLSQPSPTPRLLLHQAFIQMIMRSYLDSSIVVMAQPDHVFGHGLGNVINTMEPYTYVVCGHPRISHELAMKLLPQTIKKMRHDTTQDNRDLVNISLDYLAHPMVKHGLNTMEPYWHAIKNDSYYSCYFKEPPPLCFHGYPDLANIVLGDVCFGEFEAIDHELVDFSAQHGKLRVIDDSELFFWAELTSENTYNPTIKNDYWSSTARRLFHHELRWTYS